MNESLRVLKIEHLNGDIRETKIDAMIAYLAGKAGLSKEQDDISSMSDEQYEEELMQGKVK